MTLNYNNLILNNYYIHLFLYMKSEEEIKLQNNNIKMGSDESKIPKTSFSQKDVEILQQTYENIQNSQPSITLAEFSVFFMIFDYKIIELF